MQGLTVGSYDVIGASWFAEGSSVRDGGSTVVGQAIGRLGLVRWALMSHVAVGLKGWRVGGPGGWVDLDSRHWASVVVG